MTVSMCRRHAKQMLQVAYVFSRKGVEEKRFFYVCPDCEDVVKWPRFKVLGGALPGV